MAKIEGYCGICAACFEPIKCGDETTMREGGRHFHKHCVSDRPENYYIKLEKRLLKRQQRKAALEGNVWNGTFEKREDR